MNPRTVKNRVHVDLVADDREKEIARLLDLGATRGPDHDEHGHTWTENNAVGVWIAQPAGRQLREVVASAVWLPGYR